MSDLNCPFCGSESVEDTETNMFSCSNSDCSVSEVWFYYDNWHNRPVKDDLADGGAAQKAFWYALEFCNFPEDRNILRHWEKYKQAMKDREQCK